jgi:hypothetical protein
MEDEYERLYRLRSITDELPEIRTRVCLDISQLIGDNCMLTLNLIKVKLSLCIIKQHTTNKDGGSVSTSPRILGLSHTRGEKAPGPH